MAFAHLEPAAAEVCISYLKAFALGLFPLLWVNTLRNTVDSHGLTHYSMAIVFTSFVINVFLNYALIFGQYGFPEIGGVGAGYGLVGACWTNFILFSLVILLHPKLKGYRIYKDFKSPSFHYIREQLQVGIPIGGSIFLEASIFSIAGLLMVHFGSAVVAAHQSVTTQYCYGLYYCCCLRARCRAQKGCHSVFLHRSHNGHHHCVTHLCLYVHQYGQYCRPIHK